jgi:hypothetical protein
MCFLFKLPDVLIVSCLEFLKTIDLTNLDDAFCNFEFRPQLLDFFSGVQFVLNVDDADESEINEESYLWLLNRRISFVELQLCDTQFLRSASNMITLGLFGVNALKVLTIVSGGERLFWKTNNIVEEDLRCNFMATFINNHQKFTSIEIESEGFDSHEVFKLIDPIVLGSLTSVKLPRRPRKEGLITLLTEHCTDLRDLELQCSSRINNTRDLRALFVKNFNLTHVSVSFCTFSLFLVESFFTLVSLKWLRLHVQFIDGTCEELVRQLETKHSGLDFFELLCFESGLSGKTIGFCVDKQVQHTHKMYLADGKNPSKNWFGLCFGGSVKQLTLSNLMAVDTLKFLSVIPLSFPFLHTLALMDLKASGVLTSKFCEMIARCAALKTLSVRDCHSYGVKDFVKFCSANKNLACFIIVQKCFTRSDMKLFLRKCSTLVNLKSVVCSSEVLKRLFERDEKKLNEHFAPYLTARAANNPIVLSFDSDSDDDSDDEDEEDEEDEEEY